ncbi:activating signal cointegrator 1 complex subunit 2 homolog [Crassostrea angulata]|uniref:activating signal cointegrator 1 complex subunit 2 homolog n=1 Tax=Magallana angulata TaxID=2784310 RepID=UPI00148A220B|nr:activating signal cointegrator 1 complex subunit 2 homolog [Crassostrea gigas]XP_052695571.1 activating signal cointegrator 1 complex subunit 2 homolog [Crassostrea angulata]
MVPSYTAPHKYTGELLGVEYLYSQTGKVLQDIDHDDVEEEVEKKQEEEVEEEEDDEGFGDAEDFIDFTIPPLEVPPPSSTEQHSSPSVTVQRQPKPIQPSSMEQHSSPSVTVQRQPKPIQPSSTEQHSSPSVTVQRQPKPIQPSSTEQHSSPSVTVQRQPKPIQPSSTEQHSSPSVTVQRQPKPILHIPTVEEYRQAAVSGLLESSVPSSPHSIQKEDQREITETDDVAQVFRLERADASIGTVHF